MGLKSCVEEGDPRRCDAEEERSQRVGLGFCVCLGGWLALARQRFVLVMWQACLLVVLWWGFFFFDRGEQKEVG